MNLIKRFASNGRRRPIFGVPARPHTVDVGVEPKTPEISSVYMNQNPVLRSILSNNQLVVERQIEYMNLFLSFEQYNKYAIYNVSGVQLGWMIERETSFLNTILRQVYRTHRPFCIDLMDMNGNIGLTVKRGFSLINSHTKVMLPMSGELKGLKDQYEVDEKGNAIVVGESLQRWHLLRRKYEVFTNEGNGEMQQVGSVNAPFLAWDFPIENGDGTILGSISRTFKGIFREVLTDTGVYVVDVGQFNMEARAAVLGCAVSIDFDYFSRHSTAGAPVNYVE